MKFFGKTKPKDLAQFYQAADIFVLPSVDEGFPLTVQEAMASGLPIITSDDEGYSPYKLDRTKMCLLKKSSSKIIRSTISMLINDEQKLRKMAEYSRQHAVSHFSWSKNVADLQMNYERLILDKDAIS